MTSLMRVINSCTARSLQCMTVGTADGNSVLHSGNFSPWTCVFPVRHYRIAPRVEMNDYANADSLLDLLALQCQLAYLFEPFVSIVHGRKWHGFALTLWTLFACHNNHGRQIYRQWRHYYETRWFSCLRSGRRPYGACALQVIFTIRRVTSVAVK